MTSWDFIRRIRFPTDSSTNDDLVLRDMIRDVITCDYEVVSKSLKSVLVSLIKEI